MTALMKMQTILTVLLLKQISMAAKYWKANVMPPVAEAMKNDFPEVEEATRLNINGDTKITYNNKTFKESKFAFVDSNFFSVFTLPFIEGDAKTALMEPHTVVITKDIAKKYFSNEEAIGKLLKIDNEVFKVTGVIDNIPANSHFHFDLFVLYRPSLCKNPIHGCHSGCLLISY